jgi:hypothetical protein
MILCGLGVKVRSQHKGFAKLWNGADDKLVSISMHTCFATHLSITGCATEVLKLTLLVLRAGQLLVWPSVTHSTVQMNAQSQRTGKLHRWILLAE